MDNIILYNCYLNFLLVVFYYYSFFYNINNIIIINEKIKDDNHRIPGIFYNGSNIVKFKNIRLQ